MRSPSETFHDPATGGLLGSAGFAGAGVGASLVVEGPAPAVVESENKTRVF